MNNPSPRLRAHRLRADDLVDPVGHGAARPVLSWELRAADGQAQAVGQAQSGYQIQAASARPAAGDLDPDLYDTGRLAGTGQRAVWPGGPLASRAAVWWRVRVWDAAGQAGPWSEPAPIETGLLSAADWSADWLTSAGWQTESGHDGRERLFAKCFRLPAGGIRSARLYIAGLGVYVASLNGHRIGDAVLEPPNTRFAHRLVYTGHDVTGLLRPGDNTLGVRLASGMADVADPGERFTKFVGRHAGLGLIAQLEVVAQDGSEHRIVSDGSWLTTPGPTTWAHWYGGEDYDAREEVPRWDEPGADRRGWAAATPDPGHRPATLSARRSPPVRVVETLPARSVTSMREGTQIFDFGVNVAGWPCLTADLPAGRRLRLFPFEQLDEDGAPKRPYQSYDTYVTKTGPQTWHPEFCYHGFRYVEVSGAGAELDASCLSALVLRADNEPGNDFATSNPLIDDIHRIVDRAVQGNMFSVLTDCPHREKLGWLEQAHLLFDVVAGNYDVAAYYQDIIATILEAQTADGLVPGIAPEYVVFERLYRDDANWGGAVVLAPYEHYRWYGNPAVLEAAYDGMRAYVAYLERQADGGVLGYGLGDWYSLDDKTPVGVPATWGYHRAVHTLAETARVLGRDGDAAAYRDMSAAIRAAYLEHFHDPAAGLYGGDNQSCDALALDMGVVPEPRRQAVLDRLARRVSDAGHHLTVGEIALPALLRVLSRGGYDGLLYRVATQTDSPSYGYQVRHGATALTEDWDGPTAGHSQNHFMLGAIDTWFTARLAGIDQAEGSVGHRRLRIAPAVPDGLTWARGSRRIPQGRVATHWVRASGGFHLRAEIPVGCRATVQIPLLAGQEARGRAGDVSVEPVGDENGAARFDVGSGHWSFAARPGGKR